jgi:hypothetical protein
MSGNWVSAPKREPMGRGAALGDDFVRATAAARPEPRLWRRISATRVRLSTSSQLRRAANQARRCQANVTWSLDRPLVGRRRPQWREFRSRGTAFPPK